MGPCWEDPRLRWAPWLLGLTELAGVLLLGVCGTAPKSSGGVDPGSHVPLERVQGGSVWFHMTLTPEVDGEAQPEQVEWSFGPQSSYRILMRVRHNAADPIDWISLEDKYKHRVCAPNTTSLHIQNLTLMDSGQYRARATFSGGREYTEEFQLTVYEPVPPPQILAKSVSVTADWCNVTLECRALGASEDLNVTWRLSGRPQKWQQTWTPEAGPSAGTLAVRLPLDQANISLTCIVCNKVDLKSAITTLGDICVHDSQGPAAGRHLLGLVRAVVVGLLIVGAGLCFWKMRAKKDEQMEVPAGRDHEDDTHYTELSLHESREGRDKDKPPRDAPRDESHMGTESTASPESPAATAWPTRPRTD